MAGKSLVVGFQRGKETLGELPWGARVPIVRKCAGDTQNMTLLIILRDGEGGSE